MWLSSKKETKRANNSSGFADGGTDAVASCLPLGGEELSGDNECGGVGAPVGEEEGESIHSNPSVSHHWLIFGKALGTVVVGVEQVEVSARHGSHEGGHGNETTNLDVLAAKGINSEDSDPVSGDGGSEGDKGLGFGSHPRFPECRHTICWGNEADLEEDIFLEK